VRPTDENQAASTRPNLMSARRVAGEDNILAMLERDAARRAGARLSRGRLAWYGMAAAFSGILVGVVAWLAYDNHETASAMQVQVQAERVAEGDDVLAPPLPVEGRHPDPAPPAPPAPLSNKDAPPTAMIVDQPPAPPSAPPPLVMLAPEEAARARAVAPAPASGPEPASAQAAAAPAASVSPSPSPAPASAPSAKAEKSPTPARLATSAKPEKATARAAKPQRATAAKAQAPARKRAPAPAPAAEPGVDSDVALISAIIQHAERHRGEREQGAPCSGAKCPPAGRH